MKFIIHTDGGARGNPGPAAVGVVMEKVIDSPSAVTDKTKLIREFGKSIGETTNNVAEYTAVVEALTALKDQGVKAGNKNNDSLDIVFLLDSSLVVNQINGTFKVKEPTLRELLFKVRLLEQDIGANISYHYIPRAENRRADRLVNEALDHPHVRL